MRLYEVDKGPIFLFICGEYTCQGLPTLMGRDFPVEVSENLGARFFVVEHRFYGKSQPFTNLSDSNLRTLNSEQALEDLATFITFARKTLQISN